MKDREKPFMEINTTDSKSRLGKDDFLALDMLNLYMSVHLTNHAYTVLNWIRRSLKINVG